MEISTRAITSWAELTAARVHALVSLQAHVPESNESPGRGSALKASEGVGWTIDVTLVLEMSLRMTRRSSCVSEGPQGGDEIGTLSRK